MVKLYKNYELMDDFENKFRYLNKIYELINEYKNSDKFKNIDQKSQLLIAALKVYINLSDRYKTEYLENIKNYGTEQQKKYDNKNLKNLLVKDLLSINLSWIDDNRLYEIIRKDVYDMLKKGNMSQELSYIAHF